MKKTKIKVRAYSCEFDVILKRKEHLSLKDAIGYVRKEIIDTAMVISITRYFENNALKFRNKNYKSPAICEISNSGLSLQYLKTNL